MEEAPVSYKALRKVQQAEQAVAMLTKLDASFYRDVRTFLRALDLSVASEKSPQKARLFADEQANTRKLVEGVYALREKKIVSAALVAARGGVPDIKSMLEEERPLYEHLVKEIGGARLSLLDGTRQPEGPSVEEPVSSPEPLKAPVVQPPVVQPPVGSQSASVVNPHPLVRVVQDMPQFVGTDMRVYELRKDDVLSLPQEIAGPLLKRGVLVTVV
jgi:DNA replication initiation complex subunit (GINS family)